MFDFGRGWRRFVSIAMLSVFVFGLALLASQHLQHIVGVLPYVLLLACPLMHLFGHGHHHHSHDDRSANDTDQKSPA
jgi:DUF2933 family protein